MHPDVLVGASAFVAPDCNQHLSISICGHHLGSVHVLNKLPRLSIGGKCSCAAAASLLASPIFIGALASGPGNERSAVSLDLQIWRCLDTVPRRYTDISLSSWIFPDLFFRARFRHHVHRSRGIRGRPRSIYGLPLLENESTLELAIETQGPFRTSAWVSL